MLRIHYTQKFRDIWLQDPELKDWLRVADSSDGQVAKCRFCGVILRNHYGDLKSHGITKKHLNNAQYFSADEEEEDDESSQAVHLSTPVIERIEVVKEDKLPIRKKERETIIPSASQYKVDDVEDEFDVIGKNIANKLRKLAPHTQIYAEKMLMDVVFEAQIGNIHKNSVLQIINCDSQQPSSQPS